MRHIVERERQRVPKSAPLVVLPANRETVRLFLLVQTQWRRAGLAAIPLALDYGAVRHVMDLMGIRRRKRKRLFLGLRIMENEALPILVARMTERLER